jgi:hypothetical protein
MRRPEKIDVVCACTARDLACFKLVAAYAYEFLPLRSLICYVPARDMNRFARVVGDRVDLRNEDMAIPGLTGNKLAAFNHPVFPRMTGWYFQQILKYALAFERTDEDYYLIWDADTIPLSPMKFFDAEGRMLFVPAIEYHEPYFRTYANLMGEEARREYSFISQHQIVQKSVLREMLMKIEERHPVSGGWPFSVLGGMIGGYGNLFSEYETYGHYLKAHYLPRMGLRPLPWLREGTELYGYLPGKSVLTALSRDYVYVSFESKKTRWRQWRGRLNGWAKRFG